MEEELQGSAYEPVKQEFETLLKEGEFTEVWSSYK
jgi:hypothetical protein